MNQYQIDHALTAFAEAGRRYGIGSFVLSFVTVNEDEKDPAKKINLTIRFQEINPGVAVSLMLNGVKQAVELDLQKNPGFPGEVKKQYQKFLERFDSLVKDQSAAMAKLAKKYPIPMARDKN